MGAQGGVGKKIDYLRTSWCDKTTEQVGEVNYRDASAASFPLGAIGAKFDMRHGGTLQYWEETGGIDYLNVGSSSTTEEQLDALAAKIETGSTNHDMTNRAMEHLETKWEAKRVFGLSAGMAVALRLDNLAKQNNF